MAMAEKLTTKNKTNPSTSTSTSTTRTCDHCGKSSSSLLRCSQCQSAWYCNRTCQSLAWKPNDSTGHRRECRRLRRLREAKEKAPVGGESGKLIENDGDTEANEAWVELAKHVNSLDCKEAYEQMCRAQDEVKRLQSLLQEEVPKCPPTRLSGQNGTHPNTSKPDGVNKTNGKLTENKENEKCDKPGRSNLSINQPVKKREAVNNNVSKTIHGSWVAQGGKCCIEFLPNINSYLITLVSPSGTHMPQKEELRLAVSQVGSNVDKDSVSENEAISTYAVKVYRSQSPIEQNDNENELLLSATLVGTNNSTPTNQSHSISIDGSSVSIRLNVETSSQGMVGSMNIAERLLGVDSFSFSSSTTSSNGLDFLRCRACHNPMIEPQVSLSAAHKFTDVERKSTIESVLPLPTGYWDEISDYLSCYDGQATIDFNSSTTYAIPNTALEDDIVLVLHKCNIAVGAVCTMNVKGYGQISLPNDDIRAEKELDDTSAISGSHNSSQPWRDKTDKSENEGRTLVCANCCNALGFVSEHNPNTYRLYKHLLHCGRPDSTTKCQLFEQYTCGSFLARQMIRYAESDAIYTFVVGMNDEHCMGEPRLNDVYLMLHMLSWDTILGTTSDPKNIELKAQNESNLHFQKVLKVIFEETKDSKFSEVSDNPMDWSWGGLDLCCLPPSHLSTSKGNHGKMQLRASSIKIFLSSNEWHELKQSLENGSLLFSEALNEALVYTKLGKMRHNNDRRQASISFLPIIHSFDS